MGQFPNHNGNGESGEPDDPERLSRLVAHMVARVGDRFTPVRKLSRHFEGQEKRAGLLSDFAAALMELYRRNPDAIESLGKQAAQNFNAARAQRAAQKETPPQPPNQEVNHASG